MCHAWIQQWPYQISISAPLQDHVVGMHVPDLIFFYHFHSHFLMVNLILHIVALSEAGVPKLGLNLLMGIFFITEPQKFLFLVAVIVLANGNGRSLLSIRRISTRSPTVTATVTSSASIVSSPVSSSIKATTTTKAPASPRSASSPATSSRHTR